MNLDLYIFKVFASIPHYASFLDEVDNIKKYFDLTCLFDVMWILFSKISASMYSQSYHHGCNVKKYILIFFVQE